MSTVHDDEATGEVMLDIEVVASLCPKATIPVYFGKFTEKGWVDVLDAAVHDQTNKPSILSISWGFAEGQMIWTAAAMQQVNEALQEAALLGVTVCVSSGDDGSSNQVDDGHAHVNFPATSPYVLCVGGTTLHQKNGAITSETVWGDGTRATGGGSTGGGVSEIFPVPAWQQSLNPKSVNPGNLPGRGIPDVSAVADGKTGYFVVTDGQQGVSGGTSASTPLWAALLARVNAQRGSAVGYLTPILYKQAGTGTIGSQICRDITSGKNSTAAVGGYKAGKGWDPASGWGSPIGTNLVNLPKA
jgi:kumamolisin